MDRKSNGGHNEPILPVHVFVPESHPSRREECSPMGFLDETARFALKLAPAEGIDWLFPDLDKDLGFARWLDTENIAFPGEPKRRCDTVAELVSRGGTQPRWAVILEVEARARSKILARLLEYESRFLRKVRYGPHGRDSYQVAAGLINLTGKQRRRGMQMVLPGTDVGTGFTPRVKDLAGESAVQTLEKIGKAELGKSILVWVPLMEGGGEETVVQEWVRLAGQESDQQKRAEYAGLALVFAERSGCLAMWEKAVEVLTVEESKVISGWMKKGEARAELRTKRDDLFRVLQIKFSGTVPEELGQTIQNTNDMGLLSQWFDAALRAASIDEVRGVVQQTSSPTGSPANGNGQ